MFLFHYMLVNDLYMWGKKQTKKPFQAQQRRFFSHPLQRTGIFPSFSVNIVIVEGNRIYTFALTEKIGWQVDFKNLRG
jgi:hypothetical protein